MVDVTISGGYPNRPYELKLRVYTTENNTTGNYTVESWRLYARSNSGYGTYDNTSSNWRAFINGENNGSAALNFSSGGDYAGKEITIVTGATVVYHDANGYASIYINGSHGSGSIYGFADTGTPVINLDRVARVPAKPGAPTASSVGVTGMTLNWSIPDNMGASIDQMLLRYSTDPNMGTYTDVAKGGSDTSHTITGLSPGTTYYWWIYGHNGVGYGQRSDTLTQATLSSSPPTLSIMPSISGTQATVNVIPPSGTSGATKYSTERRLQGTTTPVTALDSTSSSTILHTGLTPGLTYEYRASVWYNSNTYQTPWSSWVTATQPNPNTSAGSYYDGSTTDSAVLDYQWTGTPGSSTSRAMGYQPTGWVAFAVAAAASGGTGEIYQALAGSFNGGAYGARANFFTDATAAGFVFGIDSGVGLRADIEPSQLYFGSLAVWPSKTQRLQARIDWYTEAGAFVSSSVGTASVIASGAWTRMVASGTAPSNASYCTVVVVDVTGTSWSVWQGGDWIQGDAAIVTLREQFPYFDGNTPDTSSYRYDWTGTPGASPSTRTALAAGAVDLLADPDCPAPPSAPTGPGISDDCIIDVGVWRRYWVAIPDTAISDYLAMLATVYVNTGGTPARQVRVRVYENPLGQSPDIFVATTWESEQILSYVPANTKITLDGIEKKAYAEVSGGARIAADKLLYGTGGAPATWPVLSCGISYLLSFDVPLDSPSNNVTIGVDLTRRL